MQAPLNLHEKLWSLRDFLVLTGVLSTFTIIALICLLMQVFDAHITALTHRVDELNGTIIIQNDTLVLLNDRVCTLSEDTLLKEMKLEEAFQTIQKQRADLDAIKVIRARNDTTQFYLKSAGVVVVAVVVIALVAPVTFGGVFSLKYWVPTKIFTFLQGNLYFLHEMKTFGHIDTLHETLWCVHVLNKQNISISVKLASSTDYLPVEQFIESLLSSRNPCVVDISTPLLASAPETLLSGASVTANLLATCL